MKAAVIFDNCGPYHLARLRAAARVCDLTAVQICPRSAEYAWENKGEPADFKLVTLFQENASREIRRRELVRKANGVLDACRPQVVFIPGWSSRAAFAALLWCVQKNVPAVAMSESTEWDEARSGWKEWIKRKLVGLCAAALVGGNPHKDYMVKLGMPPERIFSGYDAVDNAYFAAGAAKWQKLKTEILKAETAKLEVGSLPSSIFHLPSSRFFLASARFIEKKNLPRLLQAYARYREIAEKVDGGRRKAEIWHLILLGDGALRPVLNLQLSSLGLQPFVHLPGFKQYPDLPAYYGLANAFIHASTTEPWGLVVNEAMASGLPVLVSNRCGCAADLVREGVNGFTFDPRNVEEIAQKMFQLSAFQPFKLSAFADASLEIISDWGTNRFAGGFKQAADCALQNGAAKASLVQKCFLKMLIGMKS